LKAVVCKAFGPPEDLVVEDIEDLAPAEGQVLVDVKAVPVTFPDTLMLEDKYQFKAPLPYIPGGEVAGVITKVGAGVSKLKVGDRVVASTGVTGGFAQQALAKSTDARLLPDSVGYAESTGLGYAYGTTYYALKWRGAMKEGETLLVLGAGGHLGMTAIEIGKLMGARVIAAASTEEKLDLCRQIGADETINYTDENLKDRAKELTGGKGCDVIYDPVGGDYAESAVRASAWGGRFLVIGFTAGIPSVPLNLTLLKSCSIIGVFYGAMMTNEPELGKEVMSDLLDFTASGKLKPHISARYSLDDAALGLRAMMDRQTIGKIVIEP
jgi:NADPH2:quinone reductase